MGDGFRLHHGIAIMLLLKSALAALPEAVGNHVHRGFKIKVFPFTRVRPAVFDLSETSGVRVQFVSVRAFGTEVASRDGRLGITFDGNQFSVFVKHELSAANATIRTNRT